MAKQRSSYKQEHKKAQLRVGAGIQGVIVCGALAIASLVTAFTIKKSRRRDSKKEDEETQGIHFILQTPSPTMHHNQCCTSHGESKEGVTQIGSFDSASAKLIQEEKTELPASNGENENSAADHQEILLNDSKQESIASFDDYSIVEELALPVLDGLSLHEPEIKIKNCSKEMAVEENSPIQSVEEEEEEDSNEENVIKKGEEILERTGSSSVESDNEAVWPAEMIETSSPEFEKTNVNHQNTEGNSDEETRIKKAGNGRLDSNCNGNSSNEHSSNSKTTENLMLILNEKERHELVKVNDKHEHSTIQRTWVQIPLVLLLLLLYLFTHSEGCILSL